MANDIAKFPRSAVLAVLAVCVLPALLNSFGVDFSTRQAPFDIRDYALLGPQEQDALFYIAVRGGFVFTLLEWTAFCVALVTVAFSFVHYFLTRDIITPIVGTALFLSGCLDAFQILAADRITESIADREHFIPFVWAISRTVNALVVLIGTTPLLWRPQAPTPRHGLRYMLLVGVLFVLASYTIVHFSAQIEELPTIMSARPEWIHRPLDLVPLALYLLAGGIVLPRYYRRHRSLFARGLQVSILPLVIAQLYAVSSVELYDNAFNVASALKIVGYVVPLFGLLIDYSASYQTQTALRETTAQLQLARDIQLGLLPDQAPEIAGWSVAGRCEFAEAVGGDYFDFIPLPDGRLRIVVADVSGHDAGASLLMVNTRAYLRAVSESGRTLAESMRRVNDFLVRDARGRRFVTMFACDLDQDGAFEFAAAGHTGYLRHAGGRMEILPASGMPLGVSTDRLPECRRLDALEPGAVLLIATDGLVEASDLQKSQFGVGGVKRFLEDCEDVSPDVILDNLIAGYRAFTQAAAPTDDLTLVVAVRGETAIRHS